MELKSVGRRKRRVSGCHRDRRKHFKGRCHLIRVDGALFLVLFVSQFVRKKSHVESTAEKNPCVKAGMMKDGMFFPYFKGLVFIFY